MSSDLDELTIRLKNCLQVATGVVPDDPPLWDPAPLRAQPPSNRPIRRPLLRAVAAVAALVVIVPLVWVSRQGTQSLNAKLIVATSHTIDADTARIRVTAASTGGRPSTATGVVNFDVPSARFSYPSGYSVILIGAKIWDTAFPITTLPDGAIEWQLAPPAPPQASRAAELALALQPDTAPAALLSALRTATKTVRYLGSEKVNGQVSRHYRATISTQWRADVWVAGNKVVQVTVHSPSGASTVDYFDFGIKAVIRPPSDVEAP
jgi:hypothetical protein